MMVVPLPTIVLDMLLAVNITGAVTILLVSMYVQKPLDFSVFPSLLLIATMFRLALNVSATRLVLLHGFAGKVIESFGHFVVGGSLVVGLVSQIPALLISIATGLIVTRSASDEDMGSDLITQFGNQGRALRIAGVSVAMLALMPGLPKVPFLLVGGAVFFIGRRAKTKP